jgi:hypothetical protein
MVKTESIQEVTVSFVAPKILNLRLLSKQPSINVSAKADLETFSKFTMGCS